MHSNAQSTPPGEYIIPAAGNSAGGPDPRIKELQDEVERLRYQLASVRAEATAMREERDNLRSGIERALAQLESEDDEA